jgi:mRNA interferase RelE/StbE
VKYRVDFTPHALEDLSKLDKLVSERVIKKIDCLSQNIEVINPQALKGKFQGMFKLVIGDWRVLYAVDFNKKIITAHLVGHRREIYKI